AWADATRSPWPVDEHTGAAQSVAREACGAIDGALQRVAERLALERVRGGAHPASADPDHVVALLRAEGEPHLRPRLVIASANGPLVDATKTRIALELRGQRSVRTRCGVAIHETSGGGALLVAVAIDAIADLAPLPTRARTGEWLSFAA